MDNWIPNKATSTCTPIDHPEFVMPFGQSVATEFMVDHRQFNCLNRGDEKPFLIKNSGSNAQCSHRGGHASIGPKLVILNIFTVGI